MGKIKLKVRLWECEAGTVLDVSPEREAFAVRKGYAEPVIEQIKPKIEKVEMSNKVEPELKTRKRKDAN